MAQLKELVAPSEDPGLVPDSLQLTATPIPEDPMPSSGPYGYNIHTAHSTQTYM